VFDRRFGGKECWVSPYHQDLVCEEPTPDDTPLPNSHSSYANWYACEVDRSIALLGAHPEAFETTRPQPVDPLPPDPELWRNMRRWGANPGANYGKWLREGDDDFATSIVTRIDRELFGRKSNDSHIQRRRIEISRGRWPAGYPRPADLAMRLDDATLRSTLKYILQQVGDHPNLTRLVDQAADHELFTVADTAWVDWRKPDPFLEALTWAMGPLDADRVAHIVALAQRIHFARSGEVLLSPQKLWSLFVRRWSGKDLPNRRVEPTQAVKDFETWLGTREGFQSAILTDVEMRWTGKVPPSELVGFSGALRRKIKSKKLRERREAVIERLASDT
jgi:hypothetical protein